MNEIRVVNKYHGPTNGDRYIRCHRPYPLGNPFPIDDEHTREQVIEDFRTHLTKAINEGDEKILAALDEIVNLVLDNTGKPVNLVCFCYPKPCHVNVIKEVVIQAIEAGTGQKYVEAGDSPSDICECGDFRGVHENLTGKCRFCGPGHAAPIECPAFKFFAKANDRELAVWNKFKHQFQETRKQANK